MKHLQKNWYWYALGLVVVLVFIVPMFTKKKNGNGVNGTNGKARSGGCTCPDGRTFPSIPADSARCIKGCQGLV